MHRRDVLWAVLLTFAVASAAQACPNHAEKATAKLTQLSPARSALVAWKPRAWAPAAVTPSTAQGLRVERDPVDGTLSMPAPDAFEQQVLAGERRPVALTRRANGGIRAQLDENFAEFAVVRIGPDGKPRWTCVSGPARAEQFLKPPAVPAPAPGTVWEDK